MSGMNTPPHRDSFLKVKQFDYLKLQSHDQCNQINAEKQKKIYKFRFRKNFNYFKNFLSKISKSLTQQNFTHDCTGPVWHACHAANIIISIGFFCIVFY